MEPSIFKMLVDQYQTPHPLLGVDGQAFPMIPYSMKQEMLQNAEPFQGLSMDDLISIETKRVKQLLDAAYARGDSQLATRVLNELYPLMVEDIESGNHLAVAVYSPVVNQMRYIIGATQQSQVRPAAQGLGVQESFAQRTSEEPVQEPMQVTQEELVEQESISVAQEGDPIQEPMQVMQEEHGGQESKPADQEGEHVQTEPASVPAAARRKKRTPASSIVLFILGFAFILAFLLINALPFIGVGTYEELDLMGLIDIAIGCVALGLVCCVIAAIILWRSKKA